MREVLSRNRGSRDNLNMYDCIVEQIQAKTTSFLNPSHLPVFLTKYSVPCCLYYETFIKSFNHSILTRDKRLLNSSLLSLILTHILKCFAQILTKNCLIHARVVIVKQDMSVNWRCRRSAQKHRDARHDAGATPLRALNVVSELIVLWTMGKGSWWRESKKQW